MRIIEVHPDELLDREARGTLTDEERALLEAHLAHCVACRFERSVRVDLAMEAEVADEVALSSRISGALVAATRATRRPPPARRSLLVVAAALALVTGVAAAQTGLIERALDYLGTGRALSFGSKPAAAPDAAQAKRRRAAPAPVSVEKAPAPTVAAPPVAPREDPAERRAAAAPRASRAPHEASARGERVGGGRAPAARASGAARSAALEPEITPRAPGPLQQEQVAPAARAATSEPSAAPEEERAPAPSASDAAANLFERANSLRRHRQHLEARAVYAAVATRHPDTPEGRLALALSARLALDDGDAAGALRGFDAYLSRGDSALREEALAGRALAHLKLGDHTAACTAFAALLRAYPRSSYEPVARRTCAELE